MKKTIITVFAFLALFGFAVSGAMAQTWNAPKLINNDFLDDIEAYPRDALYGKIKATQAWELVVATTDVTGIINTDTDFDTELDFVIAPPAGIKYAIDENTVAMWDGENYVAPSIQPDLPEDPLAPGQALAGKFLYITAGDDGALYVLFEAENGSQYLLVGDSNWEEVTVRFAPRSLNLGSKGRWVTCKISGFPQDEENAYTPADINLDNLCIVSINDQLLETPICRDANGPANNRNKKKLMVKFDRQALAAEITAQYTDDPDNFDLTSVKITVAGYGGQDDSLQFFGEDTIKAKVPKKLKKK